MIFGEVSNKLTIFGIQQVYLHARRESHHVASSNAEYLQNVQKVIPVKVVPVRTSMLLDGFVRVAINFNWKGKNCWRVFINGNKMRTNSLKVKLIASF